jgi:GWxTD domain-containing protein
MRKICMFSILLLLFISLIFDSVGFGGQKAEKEKEGELSEKYKTWLDEEVIYIISQDEKEVFKNMVTDEMRENFIKTFWRRRDPTPDTPFNEFREEHYRRIMYVNEQYFEGRAGWRTDRGRIYIMFGPPDFLETNPAGSRGFLFGASAPTAEFPSEVWTYRHLPGVKTRLSRVDFTFINYYNSGSYQLSLDPALANALRNISIPTRYVGYGDIPDAGDRALTPLELSEQARSLTGASELEKLYMLTELTKSRGEALEELERSSRLRRLKGLVNSRESMAPLTIFARENFMKGERGQTYVPLSVEVAAHNIGFKKTQDVYEGRINFYIEVKNSKEEVVYQASDRLEMNLREETYQRRFSDYYQYRHGFSLSPGEFFMHLVVWDEFNSNVGYVDKRIVIPQYSMEKFALSEVILARNIRVVEAEPQPERTEPEPQGGLDLKSLEEIKRKTLEQIRIGKKESVDPFKFGNLEIIPNTLSAYGANDELIFFYQIYSPTFDEKQHMARLQIEHQIWRGNEFLTTIDKPQDVQIPIEHKAPGLNSGARFKLAGYSPGTYTLLIKVTDVFSNRMIEKKIDFKIR